MAERIEASVAVVGAGPAGLVAACLLGEAGEEVVIVDASQRPGGQIWRHRSSSDLSSQARRWLARLAATGVRTSTACTVVGAARDGALLAEGETGRVEIRSRHVILATGARELFLPYPGWTLPGVVGVGAAQALVKSGVDVRDLRVVVAGTGPLLLPVAALLRQGRAHLRLVVEQAEARRVTRFAATLWRTPTKIGEAMRYRSRTLGSRFRIGVWVEAAGGDGRVGEVVLTDGRRQWTEPCDLLCSSSGLVPNTELASLLGCRIDKGAVWVDEDQSTSRDGYYCVGESTGIGGVDKSIVEGQIAALSILGRRGRRRILAARRRRLHRFAANLQRAFRPRPELAQRLRPETLVCRCEDVSWGDLDPAWGVRQAKLYTRLGMGSCQSRICGAAMRHLRGWEADSIRLPVEPCRLSTLIG